MTSHLVSSASAQAHSSPAAPRALPFVLAVLTAVACALSSASSTGAELSASRVNVYPLDAVTRSAPVAGAGQCHPKQLVFYRGTLLKLEPPGPVFEPFVARLQRFERALVEIGTRVYGRAPSKIVHVGTYVCRNVEPAEWHRSEHAFGNAIDVTAFRFPPLSAGDAETGATTLPRRLRGAFTVSVLADYYPARRASEVSRYHQRFFALLTRALRERDLFRTAIGPADPRHRSHLHLDMAPWPYLKL